MKYRTMAIDGGDPAFASPRRTGAPNNVDRTAVYARLDEMFDRQRLTNNGPLVREFEERLAAIVGVRHVVTVANGTLALLIGAVALGARGRAIVPSWTFVGTVQPLVWAGLEPAFVDVDPVTHSMDVTALQRALDEGDAGLITPVHLWGRPCEVELIDDLAASADVPVLYDAAHALGSTHNGSAIGGFGDAEIFSLHATKWMASIEGGAIATNDTDLAAHCARLRNFGFAGEDNIPVNGINAKMSEMHAAVGLCQLERFDELRAINRQRHDVYRSCLTGHPDLRLVPVSNAGSAPRGYVPVELGAHLGPDAARDIQTTLEAENVHVRRYFSPGVHRLAAFERFAPHCPLPITDSLASRCIALPTGEAVTNDDAVTISGLLSDAIERLTPAVAPQHPFSEVIA